MMLVREARLNVYELNGNSATIAEIFVMKNDLAYIVGTEDEVENLQEAIGVDVPNLKKHFWLKFQHTEEVNSATVTKLKLLAC